MPIGKLGRRPPVDKPALMLGPLLTGAEISHPADVDYGADITDWQLLGNDQYGDCVAVTWANDRHAVTTALTDTPTYPDLTHVLEFYKTQNPGFPSQDDGMVIQTALETLVKDGGPDGVKAVAFAKVDHTNVDELEAAIAVFGGLWYGVTVTDSNERQFDNNVWWRYEAGARNLGGHAVYGPGYKGTTAYRFVTWAEETAFVRSFARHQLDEAWVVVWPEHYGSRAFQQGVDHVALAADYYTLTGKTLPSPPAPEPADPESNLIEVAESWLARVPRYYHELQAAIRAWLDGKG